MVRRPETLTVTAEPSASHRPESILVAYSLIRTGLARRDAHMEKVMADTREADALTPSDSGKMAA